MCFCLYICVCVCVCVCIYVFVCVCLCVCSAVERVAVSVVALTDLSTTVPAGGSTATTGRQCTTVVTPGG